jgi:hypothetical protein
MDMPRALESAAWRKEIAKLWCCSFICASMIFAMTPSLNGKTPPSPDEPAVDNPALRKVLVAMAQEDQIVRIGGLQALKKQGITIGNADQLKDPKVQEILKAETEKMHQVDAKHRARLTKIIDEHGWPGKSLVGLEGAQAAWLIVQHSDADVKFQRRCLELLKSAAEGEVKMDHIVYLTDRVLVNEGKPQRYGTQMGENFEPRPIEDAENVDKRRAEVGLPPLAEYVKTSREAYEKMANGEAATDNSVR